MASLIKDPNGSFRIEVVIPDGSRKRVRLGKVPVKTAESWHRRIEALVSDLAAVEAHGRELSSWLADLPPKLHDRLVRAGLAEPRAESKARAVVTLAELCEAFKDRASVKASTHAAYQQTLDSLTAALGSNRDIATITPADADDWRKAIATAKEGEGKHKKARVSKDGRLSSATVAKRVAVAKQVFGKAVSWGMLEKNPFAGLRAGSQVNPARSRFIDVPTIERVIAAAPGPQWRALIGLCRYAGLRCPSEIGLLTWADVDWSGGKLTVRSPKTEHHGAGHAVRFVPIVPRMRVLLGEAFEAAADGEKLVVPMAQRQTQNLRTGFSRIITKASLDTWPRLFQALRASCETDWVQQFPAHVVAKWLGHSPRIAQAHYLITTEADFRAAIEGDGVPVPRSGAETGAARGRNEVPAVDSGSEAGCESLGKSVNPEELYKCLVGSTGLEPVTSTV